MPTERESLEQAIAAIEAQRAVLGDAVVEAALTALKAKLAALTARSSNSDPVNSGSLAPQVQRKQVTALVADIAGFTALSEQLEAEAVFDLMQGLWQRLDAVVRAQDGTIYQHTGDALEALWGTPLAHENDPQRALRAALGLLNELNAYNDATGRMLGMRIGIHTGLAQVEIGVKGELEVAGEPLAGADALQRATRVGSIKISHETFRNVRGVFQVEPEEDLPIRGRAAPLQTYRVLRAYPRSFRLESRGIEGIETRMVGRDAQLENLQELFNQVQAGGMRQMALVTGEAGVGKSRLLFEFEKWIDFLPQLVNYFKGRASQDLQSVPFSLLRDLLSFRFQIQDSDRAETVRNRIEAGFSEALGPGEETLLKAHFIGHLLGIDFGDSPYLRGVLRDSRQLRDRALLYLEEYFTAVAEDDPTVVLLEDLHWADESSLEVLDALIRAPVTQRLMVVGAARPLLLERRPAWISEQPGRAHLALEPLNENDCLRLVSDILQRIENPPPELTRLIADNAGGNPFYVEELVKMLIEDGVIIKDEDGLVGNGWQVNPSRIPRVRVPPTLEGVLQARLDSLPPLERGALQRAAVIGPIFWDRAVAYLDPQLNSVRQVEPALRGLYHKELVFPRSYSAFAGCEEYIFKHNLVREAAYNGLVRRDRRAFHARAANWLESESQASGRPAEYAALIAEHYDRAGEAGPAAAWYLRTGRNAAARFGNAEAVRCFTRALELLPPDDHENRAAVLLAREQVLDLLADRAGQRRDLDELEHVLAHQPDPARLASLAMRRANYALVTGDYVSAVSGARKAIEMLPVNSTPIAQALLLLGDAERRSGDYAEARRAAERALMIARELHMPAAEAEALRLLGVASDDQGDYAAARQAQQHALNIYRAIGDKHGESNALSSLGNLAIDQGDHAGARANHEAALRLKRETGDRRGEARSLGNLGFIASDQGDYAAGRIYFEKALQLFRMMADRQGESVALVNLGNDAMIQGDYAAALSYQEVALAVQRSIGDRQGESIALDNLSLTYYYLGDYVKSVETCHQTLEIVEALGLKHVAGYAYNHLGHGLAGLGRLDDAAVAYYRSLEIRQELGAANLATESRAGLADTLLAQGDGPGALRQVEEILAYLQTGSVDGMVEPFRLYLIVYRVLVAAGDPRAQSLLVEGYQRLLARAAMITDPILRSSFLQNVAAHRDLIEAAS